MKRIAFTTLGCKANWVDTESLIQMCRDVGVEIVPFGDMADIHIVNTCTVTSIADQQSRQMLRRAKRDCPESLVIATGCVGETNRKMLSEIDEVDRVFGTSDRSELLQFIFDHLYVDSSVSGIKPPTANQSRARAFLKIQDGCDRRCAYCIVPSARGGSCSVPAGEVVEAAEQLSKSHHEIVLTGIDIGQYGKDLDGMSLAKLLGELLNSGLDVRYRLSSIDPTQLNDDIIGTIRDSGRICRHIHLSIQSCSDSVLKGMCRGYRSEDVSNAVRILIDRVPEIAITGDIIAGFPGESSEDHRSTLKMLSELPMAGLHIFPFSPRYGTRAYSLGDQVNRSEIRGRASELRGLAANLRRSFLNRIVGKTFDSIVTSKTPGGGDVVSAFSDNAVSVTLPAGTVEYGGIGKALIERVDNLRIYGSWR